MVRAFPTCAYLPAPTTQASNVFTLLAKRMISLQYQYFDKTGNENKESHHLGDTLLIKHQILRNKIKRNVWQSIGRIHIWILPLTASLRLPPETHRATNRTLSSSQTGTQSPHCCWIYLRRTTVAVASSTSWHSWLAWACG